MEEHNKEEFAKSFGKRLNVLRKSRGISMEEVALAIGSTKSAISRYENGLMIPTLESAQKLAEYFMVTVDWLGDGKMDDIGTTIPQSYVNVIKNAIDRNISAKQLDNAIEFIEKLKG